MSSPRSVRFDPDTLAKLASFASRNPGLTGSGAAAMLVEEGLRMESHPGVSFRTGPSGRRAVLVGGPDVWEVVKSVKDTRAAEPTLSPRDVLGLVVEHSGLSERTVSQALEYYGEFPAEVDAQVRQAEAAESAVERKLETLNRLLSS